MYWVQGLVSAVLVANSRFRTLGMANHQKVRHRLVHVHLKDHPLDGIKYQSKFLRTFGHRLYVLVDRYGSIY